MTQIETGYIGYHIGIIFRKTSSNFVALGIRFQELTRQKTMTDLVSEMIPNAPSGLNTGNTKECQIHEIQGL